MSDAEFLRFLAARLVNVYNESSDYSAVNRLKIIARRLEDEDGKTGS